MAHLEQRQGGGYVGRQGWQYKATKIPNGVRKKNVWGLKVTSGHDITMVPTAYIYYDDGSTINLTSSIGHIPARYDLKGDRSLSLAQRSLTMETVQREAGVQYCLLIASDGLWNMSHEGDDKFFTKQIQENPATAAKTIAEKVWKDTQRTRKTCIKAYMHNNETNTKENEHNTETRSHIRTSQTTRTRCNKLSWLDVAAITLLSHLCRQHMLRQFEHRPSLATLDRSHPSREACQPPAIVSSRPQPCIAARAREHPLTHCFLA